MAQNQYISIRALTCVIFLLGLVIYFFPRNQNEPVSVVDEAKALIEDRIQSQKEQRNMSTWEEMKAEAMANKMIKSVEGKIDLSGNGAKVAYRREYFDTTLDQTKGTILLLHGQKFNSKTWLDLGTLHFMARHGYRTIAVDLPGYDQSPGPVAADPVKYMSELLKALHVTQPIIVSPSMSGSYAIPFLFKYPDSFRGYVPVAPVKTETHSKDEYKKIQVPTLIVYGTKDANIGLSSLENLRNLPHSEIVPLTDAGHSCYLDKPLIFHVKLKEFADKLHPHPN